ncbi:hypothetical protein COMA1_20490 [Candidatus Nitrospira nitrosa]|uniref:Uncharacterized protein n=1 Tax=Candidatus Nitrospira nitrosa TaxID=1742972 RepID=A0A0S4LG46_9BACT|nr:hypothetical protein COMA1_20490 [Candidatus Nitrospira nitrosa]
MIGLDYWTGAVVLMVTVNAGLGSDSPPAFVSV